MKFVCWFGLSAPMAHGWIMWIRRFGQRFSAVSLRFRLSEPFFWGCIQGRAPVPLTRYALFFGRPRFRFSCGFSVASGVVSLLSFSPDFGPVFELISLYRLRVSTPDISESKYEPCSLYCLRVGCFPVYGGVPVKETFAFR